MNSNELEQLRLALLEQGVTPGQWDNATETLNVRKKPRYKTWEEYFDNREPVDDETKREFERFLEERAEENTAHVAAVKQVYERRRLKDAT